MADGIIGGALNGFCYPATPWPPTLATDSSGAMDSIVCPKETIEYDVGMDSEVWQKLPVPLVEVVMSKLPFSSLLRFSCLSKKWNSAILSCRISTQVSSGNSLVFFQKGILALRNSINGSWQRVSLDFLQLRNLKSLTLVATSGGLLCFYAKNLGELGQFIVCNPLTKSYHRLPLLPPGDKTLDVDDEENFAVPMRLPIQGLLAVGMVLSGESGYYKVMVATLCHLQTRVNAPRTVFPPGTTLVYDSRDGTWRKADNMPDGEGDLFHIGPVAVTKDLIVTVDNPNCEVRRIFSFDTELETWIWRHLYDDKGSLNELMDLNGKLTLVYSSRRYECGIGFFEYDFDDDVFEFNRAVPVVRVRGSGKLTVKEHMFYSTGSFEFMGKGDVVCFVGKSFTARTRNKTDYFPHGDNLKTSIRLWIHNLSTHSDSISEWEEWTMAEAPQYGFCQFFNPSLLLCS